MSDETNIPAVNDHAVRCRHENIYNHCRGCMTADGLTEPDIRARSAAASSHLHGGNGEPPEPSVALPPPVPPETGPQRLARLIRQYSGRQPFST